MMSDREELLREMRMSAHEQLYQDAIRRQRKMEELSTWVPDDYTFKPAINKDKVAQEYLRRSYDVVGKGLGSPAKATAAAAVGQGESKVPAVVDRLYACHEKVSLFLMGIRKYSIHS